MSVGARVVIETGQSHPMRVVGFSGANVLLMPFAALEGVRRGCRAVVTAAPAAVRPSPSWLGGWSCHGRAIDGKGPFTSASPYPFRNNPPPAHARRRVGRRSISACGHSYLSHLLPRQRMAFSPAAASGIGADVDARRAMWWPISR